MRSSLNITVIFRSIRVMKDTLSLLLILYITSNISGTRLEFIHPLKCRNHHLGNLSQIFVMV